LDFLLFTNCFFLFLFFPSLLAIDIRPESRIFQGDISIIKWCDKVLQPWGSKSHLDSQNSTNISTLIVFDFPEGFIWRPILAYGCGYSIYHTRKMYGRIVFYMHCMSIIFCVLFFFKNSKFRPWKIDCWFPLTWENFHSPPARQAFYFFYFFIFISLVE
jgi:hypothetical protein